MQRIVLAGTIDHRPRAGDFLQIDIDSPHCPHAGILTRNVYLSLDPYVGSRLRGRHMGEPAPEPGVEAIPGAIVGQVIESKSPDVSAGDWVQSMDGGWEEVSALPAGSFRRIEHAQGVPLSAHAGVLGMPGLTGWAGMTQLAQVREGDTVLVDAAAGPVGGTAGQIARLKGARVIGVAGGPEKCALVTESYRFDACIDYKSEGWRDALAGALPNGLTVFFENVSADMAMLALAHARRYARGVLCGLVDAYHNDTPSQHPLNMGLIVGKRAQLFGLVVYDFYSRWDEYVAEATPWIASGELRFAEDRAEGLACAPAHFERLMEGRNVGKALVQISDEAV
jgi:NADPH-dependent curcumin reductase CurA